MQNGLRARSEQTPAGGPCLVLGAVLDAGPWAISVRLPPCWMRGPGPSPCVSPCAGYGGLGHLRASPPPPGSAFLHLGLRPISANRDQHISTRSTVLSAGQTSGSRAVESCCWCVAHDPAPGVLRAKLRPTLWPHRPRATGALRRLCGDAAGHTSPARPRLLQKVPSSPLRKGGL